jgi:LysM repeat protein
MRFRIILMAFLIVMLLIPLALAPVSASPAQDACGPGVTHRVQYGENLFRISLRYNTSMAAIASANGIWNYALIFAGQTLTIPCATGYVPPANVPPAPTATGPLYGTGDANGVLPPVYTTTNVNLRPIVIDCTKLVPTSPLQGMAYGDNVFYWNPVPGATSYRVNVFNVDMGRGLVGVFEGSGLQSHLTGNVGDPLGPGFRFAWEVQALVSDIPVCTSRRTTMFRASEP